MLVPVVPVHIALLIELLTTPSIGTSEYGPFSPVIFDPMSVKILRVGRGIMAAGDFALMSITSTQSIEVCRGTASLVLNSSKPIEGSHLADQLAPKTLWQR